MSQMPKIKKGMILRVAVNTFSWLMKQNTFDVPFTIQATSGTYFTVLEEMKIDSNHTFIVYYVLLGSTVLRLFEPDVNYHIDRGTLQIIST